MMGKFFNDEYATKCTRTGRGKDKTTTVGQSELLNVLKSERVLNFLFFKHCICLENNNYLLVKTK